LDVMIRDESGHYRLAQQVSGEEPAEVAFSPFRATIDLNQIFR
jgi:hypothetical protein